MFVVGADVIGGSGLSGLPGSFNISSGLKPAQGVVSFVSPAGVSATQQDSR